MAKAIFSLSVSGKDITELVKDRILEIRITDKPGMESDELEIKLDDREDVLLIPPKGSTVKASIGWMEEGLINFGAYIIDEITLGFGPRTMAIKGKPVDMRGAAKTQRTQGYESSNLSDIAKQVATRNGWESYCNLDAVVDRVDQIGESDIHFVTRLARQYGATATVKEGKLLVLARDGGKTKSGKSLPSITLTPKDVFPGAEITLPDRAAYSKVSTRSHDKKTGAKIHSDMANDATGGGSYVDRHEYQDEKTAKHAAKAKLQSLNRLTASGRMTMVGRGDISAESQVVLAGWKNELDGRYLVDSVTQLFANGGWTTEIEINAGNAGKI